MRFVNPLLLFAAVLALAACGGGSSTPAPTAASRAPVTIIRVEVKDGKPVGGIQRATAEKGSRVDVIVHSDVADEVHVHGFDLMQDVAAGGTVRVRFATKLTGVFEIELESRGLQIAELTVK
jgi:hypothetical protein